MGNRGARLVIGIVGLAVIAVGMLIASGWRVSW
jgi:hypothetical protein